MTINFERLDAAITHGFEHPEEFNMDSWFERTPCGTTGCLAGTAVQQAGWTPRFGGGFGSTEAVYKGGQQRSVRYLAAELLALDGDQASLIFYQPHIEAVIALRNRWAREAGVPERAWGEQR